MAAIYLDVDDEITTAVARLRVAPSGAVILVVPWGSRLASSRINFRLLAREAAALGLHLVVVAAEPAARSLAAAAGLATHATVMEYESAVERGDAAAGSRAVGPAGGPGAAGSDAGTGATPGAAWSTSERGRLATADSPATANGAVSTGGIRSGRPARGVDVAGRSPSLPVLGRRRRFRFGTVRAVVALGLVALLGFGSALAASVLLPTAEITLEPASQPVGPLALTIIADPTLSTPDAERLAVPARTLDLPISVKSQFAATGKEIIEAKAAGAVTFQNCDTGGAHTIPGGATVRTAAGVSFVTAASVRLDRAKINPAFACSSGNVNVTAVKAGPEGNVVAGTITQLPTGFDPVVLSVVNRAAISGGSRQDLLRILQADVDAAIATLRTQLNELFAAKLAEPGLASAGSVVVAQTQQLGAGTPNPDPTGLVGREQATFELAMSATGTVLAINPGPATGLAESRVRAAVGAGYRLVAGSMRTSVDPPAVSAGVVTLAVRAQAQQVREIDGTALLAQIRGRSIAAARTILEPYGSVRISVWPDWVTAIPTIDGRVRLVVATAAGAPAASPSPSAAPSSAGSP